MNDYQKAMAAAIDACPRLPYNETGTPSSTSMDCVQTVWHCLVDAFLRLGCDISDDGEIKAGVMIYQEAGEPKPGADYNDHWQQYGYYRHNERFGGVAAALIQAGLAQPVDIADVQPYDLAQKWQVAGEWAVQGHSVVVTAQSTDYASAFDTFSSEYGKGVSADWYAWESSKVVHELDTARSWSICRPNVEFIAGWVG